MNSNYSSLKAKLVTNDVVLELVRQLFSARNVKRIVIVSPWITAWQRPPSFGYFIDTLRDRDIPILVVTRSPKRAAHRDALLALSTLPKAEILCNDSVHAKIVACLAAYPSSFAALGSANLTANSLQLVEVGMIVFDNLGGQHAIQRLASIGLELRTHLDSQLFERSRNYEI